MQQANSRRMLLENLEGRQLMAVGPNLVGVQPNEGELLENGAVLHVSPRELVFRFDDASAIDGRTLSGIQISRAGTDGIFERAYLSTDLGTGGAVVVDFAAASPGTSGNGVEIRFTQASRSDTSLPRISVSGQRLNIEVNTAPGLKTTAQDLIDTINADGVASKLVIASRLRGSPFVAIADTVPAGQVLKLTGANAARVSTNMNAGTALQVEFLSQQSGPQGRGIKIEFTSRDFGAASPPVVSVTGTTIQVEMNSNSRFASTAQEVIDAVNSSSAASALVLARFVSGSPTTRVGALPINYSPLALAGANDIPITPAYVGFGDSAREVVFRFAEDLPDDIYRIDVLGRGPLALKNVLGQPFNGGNDQGIQFELDLGARIEAVVPQPVVRLANGSLDQKRNVIEVYFNDDDLDPTAAINPRFYQLRYTRGSVEMIDDLVIYPAKVEYSAAQDRAILTFNRNLDQLVDTNGNALPIEALRLRIGIDEENLPAPSDLAPFDDPGSQWDSALDITNQFQPVSGQPKAIIIQSEIQNTTPYLLDFPGANDEPGNRDNRYQSHVSTIDFDGIEVIEYNFQGQLGRSGGSIQLNAITETQKQRVREIMSLYANYLGVRFVETDTNGITIAMGDMRAVFGGTDNRPGGATYAAGPLVSNGQPAVVVDIQDFSGSNESEFGSALFRTFMQGIGVQLGLGRAEELPQLTIQSSQPVINPGIDTEMVFPGNQDIVHGQFVHRPESKDIDLYRFTLPEAGELKIETFAERLSQVSLLDTHLRLYRLNPNGSFTEVASNGDYYSEDSLIRLKVAAGTYVLGVSAKGNEAYDPTIDDSGLGGRSEGRYQVRIDFRPPETSYLFDSTADGNGSRIQIDGDSDGRPGGTYDFWFVPTGPTNTVFVDKASKATTSNGSLAAPFKTIREGLQAATSGRVVRVVGNGGADGKLETTSDNLAYELGFNRLNQVQADGSTFDVPRNVTVMIDAGAILKLSRARIGVGSTSVSVDRSAGALQVLGVPRIMDTSGNVIYDVSGDAVPGSVYFTSLNDTIGRGVNADRNPPAPARGDWGGIDFRNAIDSKDQSRKDLERAGIFLNAVVHANMKYGGGQVVIDGVSQSIAPIHMIDSRPTVANSQITLSADAAMAATPNSFRESNFQDPVSQSAGGFIADFERVGPDIHGNRLLNNSVNGLFVKLRTGAGTATELLTVPGRFDDRDIVHVVTENLVIAGTAGGAVADTNAPPTSVVQLTARTGGQLVAGAYNYKLVYVDAQGNESSASEATRTLTVNAGASIELSGLPTVRGDLPFVSRRLYRSAVGGDSPYVLAAQLNATSTTYTDNGSFTGSPLNEAPDRLRAQLNGSLRIDPGLIVKLQGSRIETTMGSQLIVEGTEENPIVMTSVYDVRYGAGGTFDTVSRSGSRGPLAGDWGGIYAGQTSSLSVDHVRLSHAGGTTRIDGGFAAFNPIEVHQADARIANSRLESNADGVVGNATTTRSGKGTNFAGTIFVRGSQPVIVENRIDSNAGPAINIDVNSLDWQFVDDPGRSSGPSDKVGSFIDNQGPLVRGNRIDRNGINGMLVRGQTLTTEGIWDDSDIVHVLRDEVVISNEHAYGGLKLISKGSESLVVKLDGDSAGFTATGVPLDISDRIGGSVAVVGSAGSPVVLTSTNDCSVGAGFTPDGKPQTDTLNSGFCSGSVSVPFADVIVVMDESASMGFAQQFSIGLIADLDAALLSAGIGTSGGNRFGLVGYGDFNQVPRAIPVGSNGSLFGTSVEYAVAANTLQSSGAIEDGYQAIDFALDSYSYRANAVKYVLLVTNEDRDIVDTTQSYADLVTRMTTADIKMQGIVAADFEDAVGNRALAVDAASLAYAADGAGGFTTSPGGRVLPGFDTTVTDYVDMIWDLGGLAGDIFQIQFGGVIATSFGAAMVSSIVTQAGGNPASPGDWRSIQLQTLSNDRNVAVVAERESARSSLPGVNDIPFNSQFLGQLSPKANSGDENLRLGFEVSGAINKPSDVDVYSFLAAGGTEVWLDIDRTQNRLDTVVELVDANGNILALSDQSYDEEFDPTLLVRSPDMPINSVHPLRKSNPFLYPIDSTGAPRDLYSTNPRDAGMRVILPGVSSQTTLYHVRVRSSSLQIGDPASNLTDPNLVGSGLTAGPYTLQIRLQERDEFPGSMVQHADIRFATNALELIGVPRHSPLVGETAELDSGSVNNNTPATAQELGNILATDRQAISIAGSLSSPTDIDWYTFTIDYQLLATDLAEYLSTIFDIDYADGIGRPDTSLYLYNANQSLISFGLNSNLVDDRARPLRGSDDSDLSRGSTGTLDPFLGAVELPAGRYFIAVSPSGRVPSGLEAYFAPGSGDPLMRLQPAENGQLIVEDHVGFDGGSSALPPIVPQFVDPNSSPLQWTLTDMNLYVSRDVGFNLTDVYIVNPFTGEMSNNVGRLSTDVRDIAFRFNGGLRAFDTPVEKLIAGDQDPLSDYLAIDFGTAATTDLGSHGLETFHPNPADASAIDSNVGFIVEGLTFAEIAGQEVGFFVGNRGFGPSAGGYDDNVVYQFNLDSGTAFSAPAQDRQVVNNFDQRRLGAGTQIVERFRIRTEAATGAVSRRLVVTEATEVQGGSTRRQILDGSRFTLRDSSNFPITFEYNAGPELLLNVDPTSGRYLIDGDQFTLDGVSYEFDTGGTLVISATSGLGVSDGATVRITDEAIPGVTRTFEFDKNGSLVNPSHISVPITNAFTRAQMVDALVTAINQAGFSAKASNISGTGRISVTGKSSTQGMAVVGTGIQISGDLGVSAGAIPVSYQDTMDQDAFVAALKSAMPSSVTIGYDGDRLNFSGATVGTFGTLVSRGVATDLGSNGSVSGGAIAIAFLAEDTAETIAIRTAQAINLAAISGITASASGRDVVISNASIDTSPTRVPTLPLKAADLAPGGDVTGIAVINGVMFAVSDAGGLYRVNSPTETFGAGGGQTGTYVTGSSDLLGIEFTGLTAGPRNLANGRFANLLFGTDRQGRIWAFNTQGVLQPVFANGATSINTGLFGINGLSFSTLDYNLWHQSTNRSADAGHGLPATPNGSRPASDGGLSWYFGFEDPFNGSHGNARYTQVTDPTIRNSLNFPGGAAGVLETKSFSLSGVASSDMPMLYFNYFLQTENANSDLNDIEVMRDSFRVYIADDAGNWTLLTTNNSDRGPGFADDEFDPLLSGSDKTQEAFDNTATWRQARVDLSDFAGQSNLRLRFEFSTAGGFGFGREGGRGPEIRMVAGSQLRDGDTFVVGGQTFEIEMGSSLIVPSGSAIINGQSVTIEGTQFVFWDGTGTPPATGVVVNFSPTESAALIAQRLWFAIQTATYAPEVITGINFSDELVRQNDSIATAVISAADGRSMIISGSGVIGDNPTLAVTPDRDVDLVRIEMQSGGRLTVTATAALAVPNLDTFLRVFDATGRQLAANNDFGGTSDSQITFTAPADGIYYIGVSAASNNTYSPVVLGTAGSGGSTGTYSLTIEVERNFTATLDGGVIQLNGAYDISASAGSSILVDGTAGTTGFPVPIARDATSAEVAQAVQKALADSLAKGSLAAYPLRGDSIDLTGSSVSNSGPFGLTSSRPEDLFSEYSIANPFNRPALRAQNNAIEGLYLDDFIIGMAERGEVVLNASVGTDFVANPAGVTGIQVGPYQLEVRNGENYGIPTDDGQIVLVDAFGVNERLSDGVNLRLVDGSQMADGALMTISDGIRTVTFEFDNTDVGNGVAPGHVAIPFQSSIVDPILGRQPFTAEQMAAAVRDVINSPLVQSMLETTATMVNGDLDGATSDTLVLSGSPTVQIPFSSGEVIVVRGNGDRNRHRDQGQVVIDSTRITNSEGFGIRVASGPRDPVTGAPNPGSVRNTVVLNSDRWIPGAVIVNNELLFNRSGGIEIVGDTAAAPAIAAPVPFARIVNNTIVGGAVGLDASADPQVIQGIYFEMGTQSFGDVVSNYNPLFASGPAPIIGLQDPDVALGVPNFVGNLEPLPNQGAVSLGRGGQLVIRFSDNLLVASGDSTPDLYIREVGVSEEATVEVSSDGLTYRSVGRISGTQSTIDLDAFGISTGERLEYVRITDDPNQGATTGDSVGADIDAIGAISSSPRERYTAGGVGISVRNSASPTLLNNILVNSTTGLSIDASSSSTVVGGTTFQRNSANTGGVATVGQFASLVADNRTLFLNPVAGNFYPSPGAPIIDASIDSLQDRASLVAVKEPLGLQVSPIKAPDLDINGLPRIDDPSVDTPNGLGDNVFKDRGATDRSDFVGPMAFVLRPLDNDTTGLDLNPDEGIVELVKTSAKFFDIQLIDSSQQTALAQGTGIDPKTVTSAAVQVYKNSQPLVDGRDYRFAYDTTNGIIRLTPIAGIWASDAVYTIRFLNNRESGIQVRSPESYVDGAQVSIVDSTGKIHVFEFDLGYQVQVPFDSENKVTIQDGNQFTLDDGTRRLIFEYDFDNRVSVGANRIAILATDNAQAVAEKTVSAILTTPLQLSASSLGDGKIQIRGARTLSLLPDTSGLIVAGTPGVQPGFGLKIPTKAGKFDGIVDGQIFSITLGNGGTATFEFDSNGRVTSGNRPVPFTSTMSVDGLAASIVSAISGSGLGLSPVNTGGGFVAIGGDANTTIDLRTSVLTIVGVPGEPASNAVPVDLSTLTSGSELAAVLEAAIEAANIPGVSITRFGDRLLIEGANGVAGEGAALVSPIADLAGNPIRANQIDGSTEVVIQLGEGLDYGDAADPKYPTKNSSNGPRHTVVAGFSLGATNTVDGDARLIDADLDDGVTWDSDIYVAFNTQIVVQTTGITPTQKGFLTAWIDFDGDGQFENNQERIFLGRQLVNGVNNLPAIRIPANATAGTTFARFRFASTPIDSPIGAATDGEVEDWQITLRANPYQNPNNRLDVSGDGFISPIDALQVINYLNAFGTTILTVPPTMTMPPYLDVNGDGVISPLDAVQVINFLNAGSGEGEAEGEGGGDLWLSATAMPENGQASGGPTASSSVGIQTMASVATPRGLSKTDHSVSLADFVTKPRSMGPSWGSIFDDPAVIETEDLLDLLASDQTDQKLSDRIEWDGIEPDFWN